MGKAVAVTVAEVVAAIVGSVAIDETCWAAEISSGVGKLETLSDPFSRS